jgi:tetratricopeptide (TPR) repeat protein
MDKASSWRRRIPLGLAVLSVLTACGSPPAEPPSPPNSQPRAILLPAAAGPFDPGHVQVQNTADPSLFADVAQCGGCHPAARAAWEQSAHAHASFDNPWYRSSVESLRTDVGKKASLHCAGCHDPALLLTGAMEQPILPTDEHAGLGIPCLGCHGAVAASPDGNGSYTLDLSDIPFPPDTEAHRTRMRPAVLEGALCGSCHRGFLDPSTGNRGHLSGMDDLGPWSASIFAGSEAARLEPIGVSPASCVDCHHQGHRMPGAQSALAAQSGNLEAVTAQLVDSVEIYVVSRRPNPEELVVEVIVYNTNTGHAWPGGLADAQDTWIELQVRDESGQIIAASGDDPTAHRIQALILNEQAQPEALHRTQRFAVTAWNHTVPSRDAQAFRYRIGNAGAATTASAKLLHRRHRPELHAAACADTVAGTLDGCAPQPVTQVAKAESSVDAPLNFSAAWAWAQALAKELPEGLEAARPALAAAASTAPDERSRAAVHVLEARVAARLGRLEDALQAAKKAEDLVGPHPAIHRVRGEAYAKVWSWKEAAVAFGEVAATAPKDVDSWRNLAMARGSAGDSQGALEAAVEGLSRSPRNADLLRHQALALKALGHPKAEAATEAWLAHRPPDDASDHRLKCEQTLPHCQEDRLPIPERRLTVTAQP